MNYTKLFSFFREQKAFTAFLSTLVIIGSFSAVFAARGASAETVFLRVTDTLSTSKPNTVARHTIAFEAIKPITGQAGGEPIVFTFAQPDAQKFSGIETITFDDVSLSVVDQTYSYVGKAACDATPGTFTVVSSATDITVNLCQTTSIAEAKVVTFNLGTQGSPKIVNPNTATPQSYEVAIANVTSQQSQKIRVAILNDIQMSAAVDPILEFSATGTASGTAINGATTNIATESNIINFETLAVGAAKIAAQQLEVSTNARNGFNVTARTDSAFISENGATIEGFNVGGTEISTAGAWVAPAGTLNNDKTWGHIGLTTSDLTNTLPGVASNLWVGNFIQNPVTVFSQASSTRDQVELVGYQVQITDLQEAATDYKTNIVYVATPVF